MHLKRVLDDSGPSRYTSRMAAPLNPPQDIQDLDSLTRMAVKLRTERGTIGWPHWSDIFTFFPAILFGVLLWNRSSSGGSFTAFMGALIVMFAYHARAERRVEVRLERLEESLTLLTEEIAKRQRATDAQLDSLRPPAS